MNGIYLFEKVFGGSLSLWDIEDHDEVTAYKENLIKNSGWYNYYEVTFRYQGKRYSFQYKEHTSDNVSDKEYLYPTFQEVLTEKSNEVLVAIDSIIEGIEQESISTLEEIVKQLEDTRDLIRG